MQHTNEPDLISTRKLAKETGTNETRLRRLMRRGLLAPDFTTDEETLFLAMRIGEVRQLLRTLNQRKKNYVSSNRQIIC